MNVTYTVFAQSVVKYLERYVEELLGDQQCAFRGGRSTSDQIFTLRMILEKSYVYIFNML
jgi:hypothetical protein